MIRPLRRLAPTLFTILLATATGAALAGDATGATPSAPHWSHLPIWGEEAAARGFQIPLPFGVAVTYYDARQPVTIRDLKLGAGRSEPTSISDFAQVGRVNSTQTNTAARFDVWVLPFLNLYAVAGYTKGTTEGTVSIPDTPKLGLEAQDLPLRAEFKGPTYGVGMTLVGGARIAEQHDLTAFGMFDINRTRTHLAFDNEALIAGTKPVATVASTRVGVRWIATADVHTSAWLGAMWQQIQPEVWGAVSGRELEFVVEQRAAFPWNALVGGQLEVGREFNVVLEGGVGHRSSILVAGTFRF